MYANLQVRWKFKLNWGFVQDKDKLSFNTFLSLLTRIRLVTSLKRVTHANHYHTMIMDVRSSHKTTIIAAQKNVRLANPSVVKAGWEELVATVQPEE